MSDCIDIHCNLIIYRKSFSASKQIFGLSKSFPYKEICSSTDQVRRSCRSVSASFTEDWQKCRNPKHFCSTLNITEAEAAQAQLSLEHAAAHGYLDQTITKQANEFDDEILRMNVSLIVSPERSEPHDA